MGEGAGKLLAITVLISYLSTLVAGSLSYIMASNVFPKFISSDQIDAIVSSNSDKLEPYFTVPLTPFFDVTSALIFAFMMGISISWLKRNNSGDVLYKAVSEFNAIIVKVLEIAIIPILPFFIFGNFAEMSLSLIHI